MRVAVLYDAGADHWSDADVRAVRESVRRVVEALRGAGHEVHRVPVRAGIRWLGACRRADLVYNLCEGVEGASRMEPFVTGALELVGVPFTGCSTRTTALCHHKAVVNAWLDAQGLSIPRWLVADGRAIPSNFPLPAIVKPAAEDASVGIDQSAVVTTRKALRARVAAMTERYDDVLVQRYVDGRECNVGFVGDTVLPISEIDFSAMPDGHWSIVSFEGKWESGSPDDRGSQPVCPARLPSGLAGRITDAARVAWDAVGGTGYGRVDLRVDADGTPWVLEVNPNPDLSEDAGLARMAAAAGWSYDDLVLRVAELALEAAEQRASANELAAGATSRAEVAIRKAART